MPPAGHQPGHAVCLCQPRIAGIQAGCRPSQPRLPPPGCGKVAATQTRRPWRGTWRGTEPGPRAAGHGNPHLADPSRRPVLPRSVRSRRRTRRRHAGTHRTPAVGLRRAGPLPATATSRMACSRRPDRKRRFPATTGTHAVGDSTVGLAGPTLLQFIARHPPRDCRLTAAPERSVVDRRCTQRPARA